MLKEEKHIGSIFGEIILNMIKDKAFGMCCTSEHTTFKDL